MIAAATVLYAFQFVFSKLYQREKGSSFFYSTIFGGIVCCVSVPFLLALNGWKFEFTPFSFLIALAYAADVTVCAVFGAKTLSRANMSVYSLFLMLGGMFLPFLYGLALGESFTAVKGIAIACVLAAMIFSLRKEEGKTTDRFTVICFIVIFVTNGLTGVLTYMHQRASQPIASPSGFLLLYNICRLVFSVVTAGCVYLYGRKKNTGLLEISGASENRASGRGKSLAIALVAAAGYAVMNGCAALLTTITASTVDAGVQSTIVTGGVMALTTINGFIFGEKPTGRNLLGLAFAIAGTVLIVL